VFSILHAPVAKERLRGLVLVGAHAGDVAKDSPQNRLQISMLEIGLMELARRADFTTRLLARSFFGDVAEARYLQRTMDMFRAADLVGTLPILKAQVAHSYYSRLDRIPVPAIVICGERDRTCPRFHSERLGAEIPGSRNVWLPRVGHMVPFEQPDAIVDAVEDHLRRRSAKSAPHKSSSPSDIPGT
jgi:pimeloyl-ACP methyl ester carboxylesterase